MIKKTILFVFGGQFSYLPPFQALVEALLSTQEYKILVICSEEEPDMDRLYVDENLKFIHYYSLEPHIGVMPRVRNRIKKRYRFKQRVKHDLDTLKYDILWIIHEKTAVLLRDILVGRKYILTSYELRDSKSKLMKPLIRPMRSAIVNVQCEYNRAWIARSLYGLKNTPMVIPNKPFYHPVDNVESNRQRKDNSKIILYQGIIERERNLDGMCQAIASLVGYKLVLLGKETEYARELKSKYSNVEFPGYIKSPAHLQFTSKAYIGLVTYEPESLNCIYCAPNKIWEFSGFGIPMLCNDIPGLEYTVKAHKSGICTDTNDPEAIIKAITEISNNYKDYSSNALKMYNEIDLVEIIEKVLARFTTSTEI